MARRLRGDVQQKSRAAVGRAGMRERRSPVDTAGTWRPEGGKLPEGETFRPGKTARGRRGG